MLDNTKQERKWNKQVKRHIYKLSPLFVGLIVFIAAEASIFIENTAHIAAFITGFATAFTNYIFDNLIEDKD